jgi:glycosyltransferase involved in cell wall biosynthesis
MLSCSVIIPTYNGSAFIGEALSSVFAQTQPPQEIIVVDDCSTDDTVAVVEKIAAESPIPIRIIPRTRNSGGPTVPMNAGVSAARAELIALCDQDDLMKPNRLERQAAALLGQRTAGLACGRILLMNGAAVDDQTLTSRSPGPDLEPSKKSIGPSLYRIDGEVAHLALLEERWMTGGASNLCFYRKTWERVQGFDTRFRIAWDYEFALKITAYSDIVYDDSPIALQRKHDGNLSRSYELCCLEMMAAQWSYYYRPARRISTEDRRRQLARLSLSLGWGYRRQRKYGQSAAAYLAHCYYGSPLQAAIGFAKLAAVCGSRLFHAQTEC